MATDFPRAGHQFKRFQGRWKGLVPAGALGIFAALMWGRPVATPLVSETPSSHSSVADIPVLPLSATMVVGAATPQNAVALRGRLGAFEADNVVSPIAGMVARLMVEVGDAVKEGQPIVMISHQPSAEQDEKKVAAQQKAEAAQEEAARQQSILQARLEQEQQRLKTAHKRLDKAAQRLAEARTLVRRLQNGEKIRRANMDDAPAVAPEKTIAEPVVTEAEVEKARQDMATTAKIAAQKWQDLHVLLSRQTAASGKTSSAGSDVPTQEAIDKAQQAAQQAQKIADAARLKAHQLQYPEKSSARKPAKTPANQNGAADDRYLTADDAARIVQAALQESKAATAQVEAIQQQIDRYQKPVSHTANRIQETTEHLENVQRSLYDNPVRVQMTPVVATSNGVVQLLSTMAMQVKQGDKVAEIAPANLLTLELRDGSGTWENLKTDEKFVVKVSGEELSVERETDARLVEIKPPVAPGQPALLRFHVFNPVNEAKRTEQTKKPTNVPGVETAASVKAPPRWFKPGMMAVCALAPADGALSLPRQALRQLPDKTFEVAVLEPLTETDEIAGDAPYRLEWRAVTLENAPEGELAVVTAGLEKGQRIVISAAQAALLPSGTAGNAVVQLSAI